ncbi:alpha/beta fold hydrolase [Luteibacter pinisoli]|uniref:Alpha/beta fold hydrolase n=1 Tax=Luteibacter pinisoli TaxID=2589080 RepID=A0A4Y5YZU8_9GAMM|nr:alpha/beta fold hydrolase [Luteibacter pinisoli]QDE38421.1 alpha/beta fold hydrolase [Luteibacter pinisoli]
MKVRAKTARYALCVALCLAFPVVHAQAAEARASMETMQIPSHGSMMNALVYVAAGAQPHPTVILLHGFPGNERNLDLAQDMRRAGWNVVYFNYRGSWGSSGDFSFSHGIEDVASALAYLRNPDNAKRLRLDPSKIVLVGHSMGGFMAVQAASADPAIKGIAMISGADMAGALVQVQGQGSNAEGVKKMAAGLAKEGMAPLAGCTPESLAQELSDRGAGWVFPSKVAALKGRPVFVITSDDGLAPADNAFAEGLKKAGDTQVTTLHLPTDHAYSDQRTELSRAVLQWLATFK